MNRLTRCERCGRRLVAAFLNGRTELQCLKCDEVDPLKIDQAKWAENPLADQDRALSPVRIAPKGDLGV